MAFRLDHMSYTYLSMYRNCPRQFEFAYVLAVPVPMPWSLFFGRCFHEALGFAFTEKLEAGELPPFSDVAAVFNKWWDGGITPEFFRDRVNFTETIDWAGNDPLSLKRMGLDMLNRYLSSVGPTLELVVPPEFVARREFLTAEGDFLPFEAHLDGLAKREIIDWKSSSRPWSATRADEDLQATAYLWVMGTPDLNLAFHVSLKRLPAEEPQIVRTRRTQEQLDEFEFKILPAAVTGIRKGNFPRKESWLCRYCGYRDLD